MGFDSIDNLTCAVFDKINLTGDTSLLGCKDHVKVWEKINDEFIDTFGISTEYKQYLSYMSQYVKLLNEAVNGKDRSKINLANKYKIEAEKCLKNEVSTIDKYAIVSKYMGFRVNPNEYTVKEFYSIIKMMQQDGKEN